MGTEIPTNPMERNDENADRNRIVFRVHRIQMMEMRMDMMHKMMEQMLQHDAAEHKDHK